MSESQTVDPTPAEHATRILCEQVSRYLDLRAELGAEHARQVTLEELVPRQAARIGQLIKDHRLAEGLATAVPGMAAIGILTEFVDDSRPGEDAALEVMLTCSCLTAAERLDLTPAEPIVCELDLEAAERAIPGLSTRVLARQTDQKKVCIFRFSRPEREHIRTTGEEDEETR